MDPESRQQGCKRLWAIPAALQKQDLAAASHSASFNRDIIEAGKAPSRLRMDTLPVPKGTHDGLVPAYIPPTAGEVKKHETKREPAKKP